MMKKSVLLVLATLLLAGCPSRGPQQQEPPATVQPAQPSQTPPEQPVPQQPPPVQSVPTPPKLRSIDWQSSVTPLVQKMLAADGVSAGSVLLINTMKNNTNGSIQTVKATAALHSVLASIGGNTFSVIGDNQLNTAKQTLGLSVDDSLESRSKAIGLARYLNAQYVLYSAASGDVKQPDIELQLMTVQTGEIVWTGKGVAQE